MAAYDFPPTAGEPTDGSFKYTAPTGVIYEWNGYSWTVGAPGPNKYVKKSGDTVTGDLNVQGSLIANGPNFQVFPEGGTGAGIIDGTGVNNGMYVVGSNSGTAAYGAIRNQVSDQQIANLALSKKGPSTQNAKFITFAFVGNNCGSVTLQSNTSVLYNDTSDYRLKENVVPIAGAASLVNQLKPYRYNFISDPELPMLGFLAHEVQEVLPAIVTGEKDAVDENGKAVIQQMDYSKLTPILTAALQETLARVEALEAEVKSLKGGNN
jgi:hypothetical protein